ncbi:methyltransferase domain-containing protein [Pseudonocardia bannensis]|uniref:Class I SAM-dependent methyltransferase n=1 Tax=Pseudonocardia bannensis TaxID=630973 RepID=A0A848DKX7_9PSEU|nr:methyltransferase domain-containing protein [Pseudonocardia bannensis]NMH93176.1 class I SAM-dependent methyltransferase [Pseudonocardia bannensis]
MRRHVGRPAAVRRLLSTAVDRRGRSPLPWLTAPLVGTQRVLDLHSGMGHLADEFVTGRWLVQDGTPASGVTLCGSPAALPLRADAVDAVCLVLVLPLLDRLDAVFAEIRRVLRPGGTLVTLVPSATVRSPAEFRAARLTKPVSRHGWPNRSGLDHAGWLLAAADFAVAGDDRVVFHLPLPDAASAQQAVDDLHAAGVWPPTSSAEARRDVASRLERRTGPGQTLPIPLRRLVARR